MKLYNEINLNIEDFKTVSKYCNKSKQVTKFYDVAVGFDIETTSEIQDEQKIAYMYIWQFGIGGEVFYGRTWNEFNEFLNLLIVQLDISLEKRLIIYVHNLGYEFQFIRKFFDWENVFSVDDRKPIKATTKQGFEFKDSYILSGLSLANVARNLTKHKISKSDELDYSLVRNSKTVLSDSELQYCKNDILIIQYYISEQIAYYGDITKIPLTNTGRVRNFVKQACFFTEKNHRKSSKGKFKRYNELMKELTLKQDEYDMLKRCFMGGFTHASLNHVGKTLSDVTSIDFTSSYPSVMLAEKFPMSKPESVDLTIEKFDDLLSNDDVGLFFDIRFIGIKCKFTFESYLSESKCYSTKNAIINNGRIYQADELLTTITDIDFKIMKACYEWQSIEVANCKKFYMQYLPKPILESILKLYQDKTTLKGVEGSETEYMLSKGMLNSIYGMTVTDIIRDEIEYIDDWNVKKPDADMIKTQLETYNESKSRFLYYPWGVWVTAYARLNLWEGILNIGCDYIYSDTDSIKLLNYDSHLPFIEWYNNKLISKLKKMCQFRKIDFSLMNPKTKEGVQKMMGVWDFDGFSSRFKTLGAKRYLSMAEDKTLQLTVAGLSKKNGIQYMLDACKGDELKVFEMFNDDLFIPANKTGKSTHTYIDDELVFFSVDFRGVGLEVNCPSSIHLGECEFTLSISKQYNKFLKDFSNGYLFKQSKGV